MRPSALAALKGNTVTQSIATIENRVNGLGLTEPVIQQHGGVACVPIAVVSGFILSLLSPPLILFFLSLSG